MAFVSEATALTRERMLFDRIECRAQRQRLRGDDATRSLKGCRALLRWFNFYPFWRHRRGSHLMHSEYESSCHFTIRSGRYRVHESSIP